jgi:UrcA family protein
MWLRNQKQLQRGREMYITHLKRGLRALCLTLGVAGVSVAQTPSKAADAPDTLKVSLAGLELSTPKGIQAAHERVRMAARRLCAKVANSADMQRQLDYIACIDDAMAPVMAQIDDISRKTSAQRLAHNSDK